MTISPYIKEVETKSFHTIYSARVFLKLWADYLRRGNNPGLDLPPIDINYKHVSPSPTILNEETSGVVTINNIYIDMPEELQIVIDAKYRHNLHYKKAAKALNKSYGKYFESINKAEYYIWGALVESQKTEQKNITLDIT